LRRGGDAHTSSASRITGIPITEISKELRDKAKAVSFGALYGQGAAGLAETAFARFGVALDLPAAQRALDDFFGTYPELYGHLQYNKKLCRSRGYIRINPSNRVVRAEWEGGYLSYQKCCNLPIQGAAADCMLLGIRLVYQRFRKAGIRGGLVATVHDELLAEIHQDDVQEASWILHQEMLRAFEITCPGAPTNGLLEVLSGRNWKEARTAKKPDETDSIPTADPYITDTQSQEALQCV
jgi:DNA polymerase I